MKNIYIAAPLFSLSERAFNRELKRFLQPFFVVYLPQEDGGLLSDLAAQGEDPVSAGERIFRGDLIALQGCDILLILLDGRVPDEGACFELGYAYALKKTCIGLQTDPRRLLHNTNNPMIEHALDEIFPTVEDLICWAQKAA